MKAYAGAEWAIELWLLNIKKHWYGYYDTYTGSQVLWSDIKDSEIAVEFTGKVSSSSDVLEAYDIEIIPLFWIDKDGTRMDISSIELTVNNDVAWNILWRNGGISGVWNMENSTIVGEKKYNESTGLLEFDINQNVGNFLSVENYLIVHNTSWAEQSYDLSVGAWEYFTLPKSDIVSSATLGKYRQNLKATVDNTEFLGILKYSIYSWN